MTVAAFFGGVKLVAGKRQNARHRCALCKIELVVQRAAIDPRRDGIGFCFAQWRLSERHAPTHAVVADDFQIKYAVVGDSRSDAWSAPVKRVDVNQCPKGSAVCKRHRRAAANDMTTRNRAFWCEDARLNA